MTVWKQIQINIINEIHLLVDSNDRTYLTKVVSKKNANSKCEKPLDIKIYQEMNVNKH